MSKRYYFGLARRAERRDAAMADGQSAAVVPRAAAAKVALLNAKLAAQSADDGSGWQTLDRLEGRR